MALIYSAGVIFGSLSHVILPTSNLQLTFRMPNVRSTAVSIAYRTNSLLVYGINNVVSFEKVTFQD